MAFVSQLRYTDAMRKQQSDTGMHGGNRMIDRRLCIAPMMDWTDRHCRLFHRLIAPSAFRFAEMVTAEAILHGDRDRLLAQAAPDLDGAVPVALQLGGSDPGRLCLLYTSPSPRD